MKNGGSKIAVSQSIKMLLIFLGYFLSSSTSVALEPKPYDIIWNSPTIGSCKSRFGINVNPKEYGIRVNDINGLIGNVITLLYLDNTGLYPYYTPNGTAVNGGLPQLLDMTAHLAKFEADIDKTIPNTSFDGYGIIDWENWNPIWERNYDSKSIYRNKSMELVKQQHPTWSKEKIESAAKTQFEAAARNVMEKTLEKCKSMRPGGKWGYYLFPECYNYNGDKTCSTQAKETNLRLLWLFNASTALFPSAYLPSKLDEAQKYTFMHGQAMEARRIRSVLKKDKTLPIYVYTKYQRSKILPYWYTTKDLQAEVYEPSILGVEGIIVWGSGSDAQHAENCSNVNDYLKTMYGKFVQKVIKSANNCSTMLCNSHGRCVLNESAEISTSLQQSLKFTSYDPKRDSQLDKYFSSAVNNGMNMIEKGLDFNYINAQYMCQCFPLWKGSQCDTPA